MQWLFNQCSARIAKTAVLVLVAIAVFGARAKPKPKETPGGELPDDLNLVSLRVHAIDTIYELDLSSEQLKLLSIAAQGCAMDRKREAAHGNEKLAAAFADFDHALLMRDDDQQIAKLRNHLTELVTADDVHLDDDVFATQPARTKSVQLSRQFTVGQLAAYMASHADEITDPSEKMISDLLELHEMGNGADADIQLEKFSGEIGQLVAGDDKKAATEVAAKSGEWFKTNRKLSDDELVVQRDALEAAAKKMLGDVPPMDILSHWFENETAQLLSNPQLPQAIAAVEAATKKQDQ